MHLASTPGGEKARPGVSIGMLSATALAMLLGSFGSWENQGALLMSVIWEHLQLHLVHLVSAQVHDSAPSVCSRAVCKLCVYVFLDSVPQTGEQVTGKPLSRNLTLSATVTQLMKAVRDRKC